MAKSFQIDVEEAHRLIDYQLAKASDESDMKVKLARLDRVKELAAFIASKYE